MSTDEFYRVNGVDLEHPEYFNLKQENTPESLSQLEEPRKATDKSLANLSSGSISSTSFK